MTHQEKIQWMALWAAKHGVALQLEGECGFGRLCVGITDSGGYPEYEWYDKDYNRADENGDVWVPEDAYHKHPCVAVLGRGEVAESQLYDWLKWFDENNFKIKVESVPLPDDKQLAMLYAMMGKHIAVRMVRG